MLCGHMLITDKEIVGAFYEKDCRRQIKKKLE